MDVIGQKVFLVNVDKELVDGEPYWQLVKDVRYSVEGQTYMGQLLVAPALGMERSIVRTPDGTDHAMLPGLYSAEVLLDEGYHVLLVRLFRMEINDDGKAARDRRMVEAMPLPLFQDFLPRLGRLFEDPATVPTPVVNLMPPVKGNSSSARTTKGSPKKGKARKAEPLKAAPKKAAPTKAAPTKAAPTKAAPKKAAPKKAAPKKAAPKKAAPKKAAPKKAAPKKAAPKRKK